jgi:tRNA (adenine57-N1/adenine58-N1)-methyltransferase catalytic subunit
MEAPFEPGERVLLLDARGRRYLVRLQEGGTFHFHGGAVRHADLLGKQEGVVVSSGSGASLAAYRPRLADFILKMPRGAQVVYPKDVAAILVFADVYPGARVLEAGTGSGSLTISLARAVGESGRIVSYELRSDHHDQAVRNVETFFGRVPKHVDLREGDVVEAASERDRYSHVVLDLPQPWDCIELACRVLEPGGVFCAYLPTTVQVQQLGLGLEEAGFRDLETFETLLRTWHVAERSVRPDHRMVAHTGFVTVGRRGPVAA